MRSFRPESLLDSAFHDPPPHFYCYVFTAPIAIGAEVAADAAIPAAAIGAADVGAGALGGFSALGGADIAGLTAADIGAGVGAGAADLGIAGTALGTDFAAGGDLAAALGGSGLTGVGGALAPITAGADVAPTAAAPALSAGTAIGGPAAAAPIAPASIGTVAPTVTGDLSGAAAGGAGGGGDIAGTGLTEADYNAINAAPGMGGGSDTAGTAAATGSKGGLIDRTVSSLTGGALNKSDLGTILSAGGLGLNLLRSGQSLPGEKQLSGAASNLSATAAGQAALGTQLEGFLQSGKLPPGIESGLRSATNAATAHIKAQHAASGTSGSSAEASDIQAANDRALAAGQNVALQLLQQGASLVGQATNTEGMAAQLYQEILGNALQKDQAFGQALGNFSSALARSDQPANNTITVRAA